MLEMNMKRKCPSWGFALLCIWANVSNKLLCSVCKGWSTYSIICYLLVFVILICCSLLKPLKLSVLKFTVIYDTNIRQDILTSPLHTAYLVCHKNSNLRGRPQFTVWQVETVENCLTLGMKCTFHSSALTKITNNSNEYCGNVLNTQVTK